MNRRRVLKALGVGATVSLAGCSTSGQNDQADPETETTGESQDTESTDRQGDSTETDQQTTSAPGPDASPLTWYSANRDGGDSRFSPNQTFDASEYGINWTSGTGQTSESILSDGERIYFQDEGVIYAMDGEGGELWSRSEASYDDLAYHDGKLLTVTGDTVLIVDAETGERLSVLPELPIDSRQYTTQTTSTGLYIRSNVLSFGVVDIEAEEVLFEKDYDEMEQTPSSFNPPYDIAAKDDTIHVSGKGYEGNYLVNIDGRSGEIADTYRIEGLNKDPKKTVTQGGTIASIAAGYDSTPDVVGYDTAGSVKWHKEGVADLSPHDWERASLAIDDTNVYYLSLQSVFAFDKSTGSQKWRYSSASELPHNVLATGESLLIPDGMQIHRIDAESGDSERLKINADGVPVQQGAGEIRPAETGLYVFGGQTHHIADAEVIGEHEER